MDFSKMDGKKSIENSSRHSLVGEGFMRVEGGERGFSVARRGEKKKE